MARPAPLRAQGTLLEAHRHRHGYPEELVAGARRAAADVFARVEARLPPFTPEDGARWHRRLVERTSS